MVWLTLGSRKAKEQNRSVALDELKHERCSAHNVWLAAGKPRSGQLFELKKNAHYKYKLAIKDAAVAFEQNVSDELMEYF